MIIFYADDLFGYVCGLQWIIIKEGGGRGKKSLCKLKMIHSESSNGLNSKEHLEPR